MKHFINQWSLLTSDEKILEIVSGYKIEWSVEPLVQNFPPYQCHMNTSEQLAIDMEISRLLALQVFVKPQHEEGEFLSTVFTRPKKSGGFRMILNLAKLNEFVEYHHFKMDTLDSAMKLIDTDCYVASVDLQDAYYSMPIHVEYQKYLKFIWRGTLYQFTALPNGLSCGPRIFTKLLKVSFSHLRKLGHIVTGYIDDTLIIAQSKQQAYSAVSDTVRVLRDLGFVVHPQKSVLEPVQEITYLGCVLNSILMTSQLTVDRQHEIRDLGHKLLGRQDLPIYEVATFVGKIVAAFPGAQYGKLHYRALEKDKSCALMLFKGNYQARMNLSEDAKVEIRWWILNITQCTRTLLERTPSLRHQTDASGLGWGASDGTTHIGGKWNESEQLRANINQINYLELLAVFHALKAFCCELSNAHVVVQVDNTTAVAYINGMGGSKSKDCNSLAKHLWGWCISRNIQVTAIHIPGASNKVADYKSRHFKVETEWKLDRKVFDGLCSRFGVPEIDLFASRLNAQLDRFVSWAPDPDAESVDAFSLNWRFFAFYTFPPFCLISRCLKKIRTDEATGLMIVPYWPTQH